MRTYIGRLESYAWSSKQQYKVFLARSNGSNTSYFDTAPKPAKRYDLFKISFLTSWATLSGTKGVANPAYEYPYNVSMAPPFFSSCTGAFQGFIATLNIGTPSVLKLISSQTHSSSCSASPSLSLSPSIFSTLSTRES